MSSAALPSANQPEQARYYGLKQLYPLGNLDGADMVVDIIAIHGLDTESPRQWVAWRRDNDPNSEGVHWLVDLLPKKIPNARIFTYDWNANVDEGAAAQDLHGFAVEFLEEVRSRDLEVRDQEHRPVVFVASCFGGLLLAESISRAAHSDDRYTDILRATAGAVFLGTPFQGSVEVLRDTYNLRVLVAAASRQQSANVLVTYLQQHDRLDEAVHQFNRIRKLPQYEFPVTCFYETLATNVSRIHAAVPALDALKTKGEVILVDKRSACLTGELSLPLTARHSMICKYRSLEDDSFRKVARALKEMVDGAAAVVAMKIDPPRAIRNRSNQPVIAQSTMPDVATSRQLSNVPAQAPPTSSQLSLEHDTTRLNFFRLQQGVYYEHREQDDVWSDQQAPYIENSPMGVGSRVYAIKVVPGNRIGGQDEFTLKEYTDKKKYNNDLKFQKVILKKGGHQSLMTLLCSFREEREENKCYGVVLPQAQYDLEQHLRGNGTSPHAQFYEQGIFDIIEGLRFLHGLGIVHCDLQPVNILICSTQQGTKTWKISNFSESIEFNKSSERGAIATPYSPPERFLNPSIKYTQSYDMWSLGGILLLLASLMTLGPLPPVQKLMKVHENNDAKSIFFGLKASNIMGIPLRRSERRSINDYALRDDIQKRLKEFNNKNAVSASIYSAKHIAGFVEGSLLQIDPANRDNIGEASKQVNAACGFVPTWLYESQKGKPNYYAQSQNGEYVVFCYDPDTNLNLWYLQPQLGPGRRPEMVLDTVRSGFMAKSKSKQLSRNVSTASTALLAYGSNTVCQADSTDTALKMALIDVTRRRADGSVNRWETCYFGFSNSELISNITTSSNGKLMAFECGDERDTCRLRAFKIDEVKGKNFPQVNEFDLLRRVDAMRSRGGSEIIEFLQFSEQELLYHAFSISKVIGNYCVVNIWNVNTVECSSVKVPYKKLQPNESESSNPQLKCIAPFNTKTGFLAITDKGFYKYEPTKAAKIQVSQYFSKEDSLREGLIKSASKLEVLISQDDRWSVWFCVNRETKVYIIGLDESNKEPQELRIIPDHVSKLNKGKFKACIARTKADDHIVIISLATGEMILMDLEPSLIEGGFRQ